MTWKLILLASLSLICGAARADIITEFGFGYKLPNTSVVLLPECAQIHFHDDLSPEHAKPGSPVWGRQIASCGGDNPAFIGWPIAWESDWFGSRHRAFRIRAGWFHYSNWFDGGRDHETHMDLAAVTITYNWSRRRR